MSVAKDMLFEEMSKMCPECGGDNTEPWGTCCRELPCEDVDPDFDEEEYLVDRAEDLACDHMMDIPN
jgi:hypothetical protein